MDNSTMTMMAEPATVLSVRGRPIIFTPERIDQIYNLRERGHSPEEIAEIIGCTLGTLRVKCSQLGISLRAAPKNVMMIVKRPKLNGNHETVSKPPLAWESPGFSIRFSYRGQTKIFPIRLSEETLTTLVVAAEMRGMRISELFTTIIEKVVRRDLVEEIISPLPSVSE